MFVPRWGLKCSTLCALQTGKAANSEMLSDEMHETNVALFDWRLYQTAITILLK
jgi:hypothetical protein